MNLRLASPFHLHGVGPAYTWRLAMSGVETVGEIVDHRCLDELAEDSRIPITVLRNIQLKAESLVNNKVIQVEPFWMPQRKPIYLDIETVPKWDKVWLIGLLIDNEFAQLYAESYDEEKRILEEFLGILQRHRDGFLVTWTGFDTRVLKKRLTIHGLDWESRHSMEYVDLKYKVRRCFILPTRGYGLKRVGGLLRYPFKNPHLDGLTVAYSYQDHIEHGDSLDQKVFEYNQDDVMALPYIERWAHRSTSSHQRNCILTLV
jgi:predicted RecB family nuclease